MAKCVTTVFVELQLQIYNSCSTCWSPQICWPVLHPS